jgi:hypothetical protein
MINRDIEQQRPLNTSTQASLKKFCRNKKT